MLVGFFLLSVILLKIIVYGKGVYSLMLYLSIDFIIIVCDIVIKL